MTLRRARWLFLLLPALAVVGATLPVGCSNQGEGERCDTQSDNGGYDDCAPLVCVPRGQLNGSPNSDICCPADRSQATTVVCQTPVSIGGDSGPPVDSGVPDAPSDVGVVDAPGVDAGTDAPVDANDAGNDAPADAPAG